MGGGSCTPGGATLLALSTPEVLKVREDRGGRATGTGTLGPGGTRPGRGLCGHGGSLGDTRSTGDPWDVGDPGGPGGHTWVPCHPAP